MPLSLAFFDGPAEGSDMKACSASVKIASHIRISRAFNQLTKQPQKFFLVSLDEF